MVAMLARTHLRFGQARAAAALGPSPQQLERLLRHVVANLITRQIAQPIRADARPA